MKYSLDKYKFYQYKDKNAKETVAAASTYAGRTVKGYAKCRPEDNFDVEKGKKLAAARCNLKVAEKRLNHASDKYMKASRAADEAIRYFEKMKKYYIDSVDQVDEAAAELRELISKC